MKALSLWQMVVVLVLMGVDPRGLGGSMAEGLHQLGPCVCEVGHRRVDLTPLANNNKTARFKDMNNVYPFKFSWNPCYDFSEGHCRGVAGCQIVVYPHQYYSLGSQSSARFLRDEEGQLQIMYQADYHHGFQRRLYVTLVCVSEEEGTKVIVKGERPTEHAIYDITLFSPYSCLRSPDGEEGRLSVGSIMLITAAVMVFVYVVGGVVFQMGVRKERGVQALPHAAYWAALPALVKDGILFVKNRGRSEQMYQVVP